MGQTGCGMGNQVMLCMNNVIIGIFFLEWYIVSICHGTCNETQIHGSGGHQQMGHSQIQIKPKR